MLTLLLDRQNLHRDVPRRGVELQAVEHRPAEHVGEEHIERNRGRQVLARQRQRGRAAIGDDALEAAIAGQAEQHPRVVRVVLDNQQCLVAGFDAIAVVDDDFSLRDRQHRQRGDPLAGGVADAPGRHRDGSGRACVHERQVEREGAPLAGHADEPNLAAEQRRELAADRQSEAGAAVLPAGSGVGLLERLEDQPLLLRSDANASVGDLDGDRRWRKPQHRVIRRPSSRHLLDAHLDLSMSRELERVREQVLQDLLETLRVAGEGGRQGVVDLDLERQVLRFGDVVERAFDVVAQ